MRQLKLFDFELKREHGGSLNLGKRKETRPLDFSKPVHLILKASETEILLTHLDTVERTIEEMSARFQVPVYSIGVNADHVHLNLKFANRPTYTSWVRATTGVLTRRLRGLKWRFLPYTRIETWGRDFHGVQNYVRRNEMEGRWIAEAMTRVESLKQEMSCGLVAL